MREIKFRAWDEEAEMMIYSDKQYDEHFFEFKDGKLVCFFIVQDGIPATLYSPSEPSCEELDNLMQFTGLKDKNGKEIYEGDIVRHFGDWNQEYRTEVIYGEGYFIPLVHAEEGHGDSIDSYWSNSFEVIGNIHENSDLLKP